MSIIVTHLDLELFEKDAKSTFLNGELGERIYRNELLSLKAKEMIIKYVV